MGWRIFRLVAGWTLVGLGVIGLFLPVLQGFLFIFSGLALLSTESPWARRVLTRLKDWRKRATGSKRSSLAPKVPIRTPPNRSESPPNTPI
jgi:uncharacterized membrane protein YbaN (DUF454 family)